MPTTRRHHQLHTCQHHRNDGMPCGAPLDAGNAAGVALGEAATDAGKSLEDVAKEAFGAVGAACGAQNDAVIAASKEAAEAAFAAGESPKLP